MLKKVLTMLLLAMLLSGMCFAEEKPPVHIPQEGEFLYQAMDSEYLNRLPENAPVRITAHIDQMGYGREAVFTEDCGLTEAIEAFLKIKVGADDAPMVTDNYNWILFEWEDETTCLIRINLDALECYIDGRYYSYYLEDDGEFWGLVRPNLVEV